MNINIYGCSFSHGIKEHDFESWATELSKMLPDVNFNNYAYTGSSLAFMCYMLDKTYDKDAVNIIQLTGSPRFVSWQRADFNEQSIQKYKNYRCFDHVNMIYHYPGTTDFSKQYFPLFTEPLEYIQTKSYIEFATSRSDYVFSQNNPYKGIDCIRNYLGNNKYEEFLCDDNFHFSDKGNKWLANFILNKLNERSLL